MKLFLVTQNVNRGYDTYDSFVVCCESYVEALNSHPCDPEMVEEFKDIDEDGKYFIRSRWTTDLTKVDVKYLGEADQDLSAGIVCASFNAG